MALPSHAHLLRHGFVGVCRHEYVIPPAVPTIWWFLDFDNVNGITGLFAWPTAYFPFPPAGTPKRGKILDEGISMEGQGTDATFIVPHVPVPPVPSMLLPLIILLGSSKILMGSNKTRIWCKGVSGLVGEQERAVGCCFIPYIPISLNLQCWDTPCKKYDLMVGAPFLSDIVIAPNSVLVGVKWSDYLAALIEWAIDIAIAIFLAVGMKGLKAGWAKHQAGKLERANKAADEAYDKAFQQAYEKGASTKAADKIGRKAFDDTMEKEMSSFLPKALTDFAKAPGGMSWLAKMPLKLTWRMLVTNTKWATGVEAKL